jgi:hypothetical protein
MRELPEIYKILPESIDFIIPGFEKTYYPGSKTLSLRKRDCAQWYNEFVDRMVAACGHQFLPICRMSDGEFKFALGNQPPSKRLPVGLRVKRRFLGIMERLVVEMKGFQAATAPSVSSGNYTKDEWFEERRRYAEMLCEISKKGMLALHLSYGQIPFQEHYFPALGRWLKENQIMLTDDNYFPFYFVYAALTGPRRGELLKDRRVLVVNGASGEKRQKIEAGLRHEGVAEVLWHPISLDRSLYDRLDLDPYIGKIDLALVGAGIGKPNILVQMEPLNVPCIDAGYVFEVWADLKNKWKRAFCVADEEIDIEKIF